MLSDREILLLCNKIVADRYDAVIGEESPRVIPKNDVTLEQMMHGDLIDAVDVDWYAQRLGALQMDEMQALLDSEHGEESGFTLQGGIVGMAEQCIVVGILFERERLKLLRAGKVVAKPRDYQDGVVSDDYPHAA